jgi:hypothetical protein
MQYEIQNIVRIYLTVVIYSLLLRNEFAYDSFKCTRSLALRAVALGYDKASFLAGIPLGW